MSKVSLAVDVETLRISSSGAITANIWLKIGGREFPAGNWNDFVVVIVGWWAAALQKLLKGSSDQELIDFMDGPYVVEIRNAPPDKFVVKGLQGANRNVEVAVGEIEAMPFIAQFIDCAQNLLDSCRDRSFRTSDIETLQIYLHALRREYFGRRGSEYIL